MLGLITKGTNGQKGLKDFLATMRLTGQAERSLLHDDKGEAFIPSHSEKATVLASASEITATEYLEMCRENGMEPEEAEEDIKNAELSAEDRATRKTAYLAALPPAKAAKVMQKDRIVTFRASDETVDRSGDIVRVDGWNLTDFKKNPVFLDGHDYHKAPLGRVVKAWKENADGGAAGGKSLMARVYFPTKDVSEASDAALRGIQGGLYGAVSVGFMPEKVNNPADQEERSTLGLGKWGVEFLKQKLWELSLVTVPANQNALVVNSAEHADICKSMGVKFELKGAAPAADPEKPVTAAELAAVSAELKILSDGFKTLMNNFKSFRESMETIEEACVEILTRMSKPEPEKGGAGHGHTAPDAPDSKSAFDKVMESINGMNVTAPT